MVGSCTRRQIQRTSTTVWLFNAILVASLFGTTPAIPARGNFHITVGGSTHGITAEGDETVNGVVYRDDAGFVLDWDPAACNYSATHTDSCIPKYMLPTDTDPAAKMSFDEYLLLPNALAQRLLNNFSNLDEIVQEASFRFDRLLDLNMTVREFWDSQNVPTLDEFLDVIREVVLEDGNEVYRQINSSDADLEWLKGSASACQGMSRVERALSSNTVCSSALLTTLNADIRGVVSELTAMEHNGLAGLYEGGDRRRRSATGANNSEERRDRTRRNTCSSRPDPYAIWTDFDDVKGPFTTNAADYRIRRQLVVLMRFADHNGRSVPTRNEMDNIMNCRTGGGCSTGDSTSSVRDYFLHQSYFKSDTISTVTDWVTIGQSEFYTSGPGQYGKNNAQALSRLCSAMQEALTLTLAANPTLNLNDFVHDCDGDNQTNNGYSELKEVLFFHSGYPAEFSSSDSANRIWSHRFRFGSLGCAANTVNEYANPVNQAQTFRIPNYLVTNGCYGDGSEGDSCPLPRLGVIAHEMGHSTIQGTAVADFYELYDGQSTLPARCGTSGSGKGIDAWGLMGDSWGACGDQVYPPSMTAWAKIEMGWITPQDVRTATAETFELYRGSQCPSALQVSYNYGDNFGLNNATTESEFLIVEYRQKSGHDSGIPSEGMIVYHVDLQSGTGGANRRPRWSTEPYAHYYLRVEQGDGSDELECGTDANGGDTFKVGTSITNSPILSQPYRSTRGYQTGLVERDTGITLRVDSTTNDGKAILVQYTTSTSVNPNRTVSNSFPATCSAGSYGQSDGSCTSCPVGKYSHAGSPCISGCQLCPDGKYANSEGTVECEPCPPGTYDDITYYPSNESSCKLCPSTTDINAFGAIPLRQMAFEYCQRGGSFAAYQGGAYARYDPWTVDCGVWTFLGLTEDQWMMLIFVAIGITVVSIVLCQFYHHYKRRRPKHMVSRRPRKDIMIRTGFGYDVAHPAKKPRNGRGKRYDNGKAAPPPRTVRKGSLSEKEREREALAVERQRQRQVMHQRQMRLHMEQQGLHGVDHAPPPGYHQVGQRQPTMIGRAPQAHGHHGRSPHDAAHDHRAPRGGAPPHSAPRTAGHGHHTPHGGNPMHGHRGHHVASSPHTAHAGGGVPHGAPAPHAAPHAAPHGARTPRTPQGHGHGDRHHGGHGAHRQQYE